MKFKSVSYKSAELSSNKLEQGSFAVITTDSQDIAEYIQVVCMVQGLISQGNGLQYREIPLGLHGTL